MIYNKEQMIKNQIKIKKMTVILKNKNSNKS